MSEEAAPEQKHPGPVTHTGGGAVIHGSVSAGGDVIGRDQVIYGYTAEQVSLLIAEVRRAGQPRRYDGAQQPYLGLAAFQEADAAFFFGREKLVAELVERVRGASFVCIAGPSGSGKSSLVQAGLLVALKRGCLPGSGRWLYAALTPRSDPLEQLARAIERAARSPKAGDYLRGCGLRNPGALHEQAETLLEQDPAQRLVLFVDQFEELFSPTVDEPVRQAFIDLLTQAALHAGSRVSVLLALRADFVDQCARYPQLRDLISRQFQLVGAMAPEELARAIILPALEAGVQVDPHLAAQVIADMKHEPGALPLMQFALKDLFDARAPRKGEAVELKLADYLARGGVYKALERHADAVLAQLDVPQRLMAYEVFSRLVEIRSDLAVTRQVVRFDQLASAQASADQLQAVVEKLAQARLVTIDEQAQNRTLTLAHEKLIEAWPWLAQLVQANRDQIAMQNQLARDAEAWRFHGKEPSYLYRGLQLEETEAWVAANPERLGALERQFYTASLMARQAKTQAVLQAQVKEEQKRKLELTRAKQLARSRAWIAVILGSGLGIALLLAGLSYLFYRQSQSNLGEAQVRGTQAAQNLLAAESSAATAEAERSRAEAQSQIALARQLAAQAQSLFANQDAKEMTAVQLAVQSMQISPSIEAAEVLQNHTLARQLSRMTHDGMVNSVAFSADGRYALSGGGQTARVWEVSSGQEVARMTHDNWANAVAFSPDGRYAISGSLDKTARVWEVSSGKEVSRLAHDDNVTSVAFSPDGRYALSGSEDKTARVWEVSSGQEISRMTHDGAVTSEAFSVDGRYAISGSIDGTARVWEVNSGKEVARMTHDNVVRWVAFSPDGRYAITGSYDQTARVWEISSGQEVSRMTHTWNVTSVAFSRDGHYAISGSDDNTARVWAVDSGQEVSRMTHDAAVRAVAFSLDGRYAISGSMDGTARVWEVSSGKEVARMTHNGPVDSVAFSPDGRYALSGGDRSARVWAISSGQEVARNTHDGPVASVVFSPDGRYAISGSLDYTARVWEVSSGQEVSRMTHDSWLSSLAFSPDGRYAISGSADNTARVWEVSSGKEVARMTHADIVRSVVFSPDGRYAASVSDDKTVRVWEVSSGQEVSRMAHDSYVYSVAFSADGRYVISGGYDKTARVWEISSGQEVSRMTHAEFVNSVAFSPDGNYAISGSYDNTARVWKISSGKEVSRMTHAEFVNSVAFSPDGNYAISGSADDTARVWEVSSGKEVSRMTHADSVTSVAFSPDGRYAISGSLDKTSRVWAVSSGQQVARMTHNGWVNSVAFSPDGHYAISGSNDQTARVWYWQPADLIAEACARLPRNLTYAEWEQYIGAALPYQAVCPDLPLEPAPTLTPGQ